MTAAMEFGGEVVAGARIPAQHAMDTLENLEIWN